MMFGQIGFLCPVDGQMTVGLDCVEDMVVHRRGHADISVRCPKCGTLVKITTQTPIIPRPIVEALSNEIGVPFEDGKITFSTLMGSLAGAGHTLEFTFETEDDGEYCEYCEDRLLGECQLTDAQEKQIGFFASELDKLASVDEFLSRVQEDAERE